MEGYSGLGPYRGNQKRAGTSLMCAYSVDVLKMCAYSEEVINMCA